MNSGSHRKGRVWFLWLVVAWMMLLSSVAAVAQVDDGLVEPDTGDEVVVDSGDGDLVDPGVADPGAPPPVLKLADDVHGDDPVDPVLPPPKVEPIVVDDPLPVLPVWEGNPELERPGLVVGVSEVVVDPGEKRAAPALSAVSFEVAEKAEFPTGVTFEVETFKPELAESVSPFGAGFRIAASVGGGEVKWSDPVDVVVDYEDLAVVHGAGAASRMQLTLLEGCELVEWKAGDEFECKSSTVVDSVNNPTDRVLRATLLPEVLDRVLTNPTGLGVSDLADAGFTMLVLTSGASGPGGDFAAAPFQTVSSWSVGEFSGAAETSYPIELPTAAVGPTPSVMLSYSSAAIDGMHEFSNNQVGSIGAGWSYTPGYITRHLKPCTSSGHLCTAGDEYSIVLNGVSSRLIWLGGASFKVQDDPYWLVTRKTHPSSSHPDANDKYWEVTGKDGTKYIFGYTNDSAQTIPLNGGADHVYQWDLSEIRDTDGNSAFFTYGQEINRYGSGLDYVQASHLELIEYSFLSGQPSLRVRFNHEVRCGDASSTFGDCAWPSAFVDTPTDLWCPSGSCSVSSPTFWTGLRLGSIQVQTLRNPSGDRWSTLALYDLAQYAPTPDHSEFEGNDPDASEPRTLLYRIHRRPEGQYTYNAYQQIEAEGYTFDNGGVSAVASNDVGGGDAISWSSSTHLSFHETQFEQGATEIVVRVASNYTGQQVKVYDSYPFTTARATINVPDTGGVAAFQTVSVTVSGLSGTESLYLALSGTHEARLNWVRFKPASTQQSLPAVDYYQYDWQWLGNRKNHPAGLSPMAVARVGTIRNEYGGKVSFTYLNDGNQCVEWPQLGHWKDNTEHCFPADAGGGTWITFLKWVVNDVTVYDPVMATTQVYEYTYGTPRWAKNISPTADLCDTSWNVFRGHSWVEVVDPFGLTTTTWFYQGMKDDLVNCTGTVRSGPEINISVFGTQSRPDYYWLVGRPAGSITADTAGVEFSRTNTDYVSVLTGGSGPRDAARFIGVDAVDTTTTGAGTAKTTRVSYLYDSYGNITQTYQHGDLADSTDKRFTSTTYVYQTSTGYIVDRPKETKTFDVTGSGDVLIGKTWYFWDSGTYGAAPTEGHLFYERHYKSSTGWVQSFYTYKPDGRLATVRDPNLHTTTYTYDDVGVPYGRLVSVTDAAGLVTGTGYDAYFRVNSETDPRNLTTSATRDSYGRITAVTAPGSSTEVLRYHYTDSTPARLWTESRVESDYVDSYTYADGFGRAFQTQTVSPNSGQRVVTTSETISSGVLKYQSEPFETSGTAGSGAVSPTWTSLPLWHRYQHNSQGEQTNDETMILDDFQWDVVTAAEGWWKTTATDPNNTNQIYYYDPFGNPTQIKERIDGVWYATTYEYDKANRLVTVTDSANPANVTQIVYDWMGRKTSIDDPDMGTWSYLYDNVGNLTSQTDGRDITVQWEYDAINRPTRRYSGGATLAEWSYYTSGSNKGLLDWSKAYDSSFGTIEQNYDAYDNGGRVTDQRTVVPGGDGGTFRMRWSYDLAGSLLSTTYPGGADGSQGEEVAQTYNALGQPDGLDGDDTYVADADYYYWGARDTQTWGTGATAINREFTHRNNRRLYMMQAGTGSSVSNLFNTQVSRTDSNGNILLINDWHNGGQRQCFEYDQANRLRRAFTTTDYDCGWVDTTVGVGGYDHTFTYDPIGNLKTRTDVTGAYNYGAGSAGPHAVTSIGGRYSFSYDDNGNQVTRTTPAGSQSLYWNTDNQLDHVTEGSDTTEFFYDADGSRVVRVTPDETTIYIAGVYEYQVDDSTAVNVAPNPGFETGTGWTEVAETYLGEATSHERSTWGIADNHTGTYGRAITNITYGYLQSDSVPVVAGHTYDVSAWMRGQIDPDDSRGATGAAWIVRVYFYNSSGSGLSSVDVASGGPVDLSTTWSQKGGQVTAPAGAATAKVQLYFYNGQGWVAYDDISMVDVAYPSTNLVTNPGFESSGAWTEVATGPLGEATGFYRGTSGIADQHSGSYGYVISNVAYGYARSNLVPVAAGTAYDVYGWVRGKADTDSSYGSTWIIRVRWYNSQGTYLTYTNADYGGSGELTTSWQHLGGRVTAPSNATQAAVDLFFYDGTGWIAYDDVTFIPVVNGGSNLLDDPGFESGDGWTGYVSSSLGESTSLWRGTWGFGEPRSGTYSYVITNTTYGWLQSDPIDVTAGQTYNLATWLQGRTDPEDSRDGWVWTLRVNWFDSAQQLIGYDNTAGGAADTVPTSWTEVGGEVTAPYGAVTAKIQIYLYMGSGWINIDDVTFAPTPTETLYYNFAGDTVGMRTGGELHWMFTDHLGSTLTTYKADGTQQPQRQYYYPWGNLRGSTEPTIPTDVGYTGQTLDTTTGLMYYHARYYDPTIGRFTAADTIIPNPANPQDLNRYSYVLNNPVLHTDPSGHCSIAGQQIYAGPCQQTGSEAWDYGYDYDWGNPDTNGCVGCRDRNWHLDSQMGGDPIFEFADNHKAEISLAAAVVATFTSGGLAAGAFGVAMAFGTWDTVDSCASAHELGCGLGVASLGLGGGGKALELVGTRVAAVGGTWATRGETLGDVGRAVWAGWTDSKWGSEILGGLGSMKGWSVRLLGSLTTRVGEAVHAGGRGTQIASLFTAAASVVVEDTTPTHVPGAEW